MKIKIFLALVLVSVIAWVLLKPTPKAPPGGAWQGMPSVEVAPVTVQEMPSLVVATGHVIPSAQVEVRPQLAGVIRRVAVKEGQWVTVGTRLFELESGAEQVAVRKAQAQRLKDAAAWQEADRAVKRNQTLAAQGFLSTSAVESSVSQREALGATLAADDALIAAAQLDLSHKMIYATLAGKVGLIEVVPGSVVQASGNALTTIIQLRPIAVSFTVPEADLPRVQQLAGQGKATVWARLSDQVVEAGVLTLIDNRVDAQSGTLRLKAQFDNEKGALWSGQYVTVTLDTGMQRGPTVPLAAILVGPQGKFVYVIEAGEAVASGRPSMVAVLRPVEVLLQDARTALVKGVRPGERVVINGALNVRPGQAVNVVSPAAPGQAKWGGKKGGKAEWNTKRNTKWNTQPKRDASAPLQGSAP